MSLLNKPKSEMTPEELQKREEEEFNTGPLSVLTQSVKNNTQCSSTAGLNPGTPIWLILSLKWLQVLQEEKLNSTVSNYLTYARFCARHFPTYYLMQLTKAKSRLKKKINYGDLILKEALH
uniref:Small nuclear ribonucleoprotein D2 polypeptide n=1 Tax=Sus scrofa TaxID=9823 RepID=A0A8D1NIQ3_PIG